MNNESEIKYSSQSEIACNYVKKDSECLKYSSTSEIKLYLQKQERESKFLKCKGKSDIHIDHQVKQLTSKFLTSPQIKIFAESNSIPTLTKSSSFKKQSSTQSTNMLNVFEDKVKNSSELKIDDESDLDEKVYLRSKNRTMNIPLVQQKLVNAEKNGTSIQTKTIVNQSIETIKESINNFKKKFSKVENTEILNHVVVFNENRDEINGNNKSDAESQVLTYNDKKQKLEKNLQNE